MTNNKLGAESLDIGQEVIAKIRVSEGTGYNLEVIIFHLFEKMVLSMQCSNLKLCLRECVRIVCFA